MPDHCRNAEPFLSAWVDGELTGAERRRLAVHLRLCAACAAEVEDLRSTRTLLRSLPVRRLPDGVLGPAPEPRRQVSPEPQRQAPARSAHLTRAVAAAVAVGAMGAAALLLGVTEPDSPRRVAVPVDVFVADHLVRTATDTPVLTPVLVEGQ